MCCQTPGNEDCTKIPKTKLQLIEAIIGPEELSGISREQAIVLVTRTFRVLEQIWKECGPHEVWKELRSDARPTPDVSLLGFCKPLKSEGMKE